MNAIKTKPAGIAPQADSCRDAVQRPLSRRPNTSFEDFDGSI